MCSSHVCIGSHDRKKTSQVVTICDASDHKSDICDASLYLTQITLVYFKCNSFHFSTVTPKIALNSLQLEKLFFLNQHITKTINSLSLFLTLDNFSPVLHRQVHRRVFFRLQFFRQSFLRLDLDYLTQ